MSGVSTRGGAGGSSASIPALGGLGAGAGAIDPMTLSLHYCEVEMPLRPMGKDLKCQVTLLLFHFIFLFFCSYGTRLQGNEERPPRW